MVKLAKFIESITGKYKKCLWCGKELPDGEWWCSLYHRYKYYASIKKWGF